MSLKGRRLSHGTRKFIIMATSIAASSAASNVFASTPQFTRPTFLMCPPEWYGVDYVLNPWMAGNVHRSSRDLAFAQWKGMHNVLRSVADVAALVHRVKGA